jgi:hypothetical protein
MVFGWFRKKKQAADKTPAAPAAGTRPTAPPLAATPPQTVQPSPPPPAPPAPAASPAPARAPWGVKEEIEANQAIGNLRNLLLAASRTDRGIHAETLLVTAGALTGFAVINTVFEAYLNRGRARIGDRQSTDTSATVVEIKTADGQSYYFGDLINSFLVAAGGKAARPFFVWGYLAGVAINSGVPAAELPDLNEMFQHAAKCVGTPEFGMPRMPPNLKPMMTARQAVDRLWPAVRQCLARTDGPGTDGRAVDVEHWPIVCAIVAQQLIGQAKGVIDMKVALRLVMESAVFMSKIDPKTVPQQQPAVAS